MIRKSLEPKDLAASMYSSFFIAIATPLITLANIGAPTIINTIIKVVTQGTNKLASSSAIIINGNVIIDSMSLIMILSTNLP